MSVMYVGKNMQHSITDFGFSSHLAFRLHIMFMVQTIYRHMTVVQKGEN